ncbi:hypothetical protein EJB05_38508 [Eragrostis curvula]|uniref:Subtilisin-like protease fibronectin type-III domain-containing protein n=1 Tax=Eragrostis curvula TaxID=38414 RepID=A0A5J9TUB1_9POAL|nr:hypothetical protein EJB05_38508 [Eragrostis curvula]
MAGARPRGGSSIPGLGGVRKPEGLATGARGPRVFCKRLSRNFPMALEFPHNKPSIVFCSILTFLSLNCGRSHVSAKVYMVVMEDDPVISHKASRRHIMRGEEAQKYKAAATTKHDIFLDSFLPTGAYKKLYSYTHLLNGFAIHAESEEAIRILRRAKGVRLIQEDVKMTKTTTHTPDFIGASTVWPRLGGPEKSGDGVVIGMIDTGIDPENPSFVTSQSKPAPASFKGICRTGNRFPAGSCSGKVVGAMWFARAAQATGEFNATIHYASPYDPDGHGSHTASTAAGNFNTPVISRGYNFGYASGMAPGASLAIYKAAYPFGGYMSDVIAAVDQAVEDGVDVISLSMAPDSVPTGPATFLNLLETQLLLATKAGVIVVQAAGNGGPDANSVVSFSPWILTVAASTTDRKYRKSIITGDGKTYSCGIVSPPTPGKTMYPLALADDVIIDNSSDEPPNCLDSSVFSKSLVEGKVIICKFAPGYIIDYEFIDIINTIQKVGAAGVIITGSNIDVDFAPTVPTAIPSAIFVDEDDSLSLMRYYNSNIVRDEDGKVDSFGATVRIQEGRRATYSGEAPIPAYGRGGVPRWCSDLNTPSVTVASLVGSRRVDRRVTSVGSKNETYTAYVRAPDGVAVRVVPTQFGIAPGAKRTLQISLRTTAPGNAFSFGEVVLKGDKKHTVRIPLAVYPAARMHP